MHVQTDCGEACSQSNVDSYQTYTVRASRARIAQLPTVHIRYRHCPSATNSIYIVGGGKRAMQQPKILRKWRSSYCARRRNSNTDWCSLPFSLSHCSRTACIIILDICASYSHALYSHAALRISTCICAMLLLHCRARHTQANTRHTHTHTHCIICIRMCTYVCMYICTYAVFYFA